jgi:hypothetical protein
MILAYLEVISPGSVDGTSPHHAPELPDQKRMTLSSDLASTDAHVEGKIRNFDPCEPSLIAKRGHADLNAHPWIAEL